MIGYRARDASLFLQKLHNVVGELVRVYAIGIMVPSYIVKLLTVVGILETIFLIVTVIWGVFLWIKGIAPVLYRLGNGLARKRIAIFAKGDNLSSVRDLLKDTKIFNQNFIDIPGTHDLEKAEEASVYVVFWPDWSSNIKEILDRKPASCPLIIYAPYENEKIPAEVMRQLDGKRHTIVTNFRGRLLNDVVASMITVNCD